VTQDMSDSQTHETKPKGGGSPNAKDSTISDHPQSCLVETPVSPFHGETIRMSRKFSGIHNRFAPQSYDFPSKYMTVSKPRTVLLQVKMERSPFRVSYNLTGASHHAQDPKSILGGSKSGHSTTPFDRPNIHRRPLRRIKDSSHDVLPVAGPVLRERLRCIRSQNQLRCDSAPKNHRAT
jgi:hypothetical protein